MKIKDIYKYYRRASGFTFCFVGISNFATTFLGVGDHCDFNRSLMTDNYQLYFTALFYKSTFYALLWPTFYLTAINKPQNAFVLGASAGNLVCGVEVAASGWST